MRDSNYTIIAARKDAAIVEFSRLNRTASSTVKNDIMTFSHGKVSADICQWGGNKNDLPLVRENLIRENHIVGELIKTKRDITIGQGIFAYKEVFENGERRIEEVEMPKGLKELIDRMDDVGYFTNATKNLVMHDNIFAHFIVKNGKVFSIGSMDSKYIRAMRQRANGKIPGFVWFSDWGRRHSHDKSLRARMYRSYDFRSKRNKGVNEFIYHVYDDLLFDGYYAEPAWWGGREWLELANNIPQFHKANLKHGYNIRYHIKIPHNYFLDQKAYQQATDDEDRDKIKDREKSAEQDFLKKLNDLLQGAENSGKAIVTKFRVDRQLQKEYPGIKIETIPVDLKDEALLKLFDKSNDAATGGQGIPPVLAAIATPNKLSSGSEIRNSFNAYVGVKTPAPRKILLKPLQKAMKINDWGDNIKVGFRDIEIQKLDDNPEGQQEVAQPND